jgi:hypothetical protein
MKVGDLVKLNKRFRKGDDLYLVCERHRTWDWKRHDGNSPFAVWVIVGCQNGQIYTQTTKDLEIVNESR